MVLIVAISDLACHFLNAMLPVGIFPNRASTVYLQTCSIVVASMTINGPMLKRDWLIRFLKENIFPLAWASTVFVNYGKYKSHL